MSERRYRIQNTVVWYLMPTVCLLAHTGFCFAQEKIIQIHRGIELKTEVRYKPRLVRLYFVKIDLKTPGLIWDVAVGPDPDGDGPSEASLVDPVRLAESAGFLVAIAANAWGMLPANTTHLPDGASGISLLPPVVNISGWVKTKEGTISKPEPGRWSFWINSEGFPEIGNPLEEPPARIAASGFGPLILQGRIVVAQSAVPEVQSGVAIDPGRSFVLFAVADGRRPGWSQGLTPYEFAEILRSLGGTEAMRWDSGGTAALLVRLPNGQVTVVNRPSDLFGPRPVPVLIGVKQAPKG